MIVVAIIGVLASVAVPKFSNMISKSREGAVKGSLSALRSALEIYKTDNEGLNPYERVDMWSLTVYSVALGRPSCVEAFYYDNAGGNFSGVLSSKYIAQIPEIKITTNHRPSSDIWLYCGVMSYSGPLPMPDMTFDLNRSTHTEMVEAAMINDDNNNYGWVYLREQGTIWLACQHTDTKNDAISGW